MTTKSRSRAAAMLAVPAIVMMACGIAPAGDDREKPEDVLKGHGLKKSGSVYILPTEADAQKKLNEARLASKQLNYALAQQDAVEQGAHGRKALVQELTQERIALNQQMQSVDQALGAAGGPNGNGNIGVDQRNFLVNQHNQLVAELNIVTDRLNLLHAHDDPQWAQKLGTQAGRARQTFLQAVLDLRQIVDKTTARYAELAGDDAIKGALAALSARSKSPVKLGPSRGFDETVKLLAKVEKSVLTEVVELRRKGGVFEVDVTFNEKITVPLVFDTGASLTTISADLAARIGLTPQPTDEEIELHIADGSAVKAHMTTIPSMRVGKFTVNNVACAVMPAAKVDAPLLLGQSFHRHFTYKFTPESGQLVLSKVEAIEPPTPAKTARTTKKTTKGKRSNRSPAPNASTSTDTSAPATTDDPGH